MVTNIHSVILALVDIPVVHLALDLSSLSHDLNAKFGSYA